MVQLEEAKVLRDFDDVIEQKEEPIVIVAPSRFNKKFGLAALGIAAVCGLIGASIATFGGFSSSSSSSVVDEFSASGVLTSSTLEDTPADLGDATFGVYFNRDKDTKEITFEMNIAATDSNGHILTVSVVDGQYSLWTTGPVEEYTDDEEFIASTLPAIAGKNLYDCDFTVVALKSWEEEYAIDSIGDTITINLGEAGGSVIFTMDAGTGLPTAVTWGEVSGSITSFEAGSSKLRGALGSKVPFEYPCVAGVEPVRDRSAEAVIADLTEEESDALVAAMEMDDAVDGSERRLSDAQHERFALDIATGGYTENGYLEGEEPASGSGDNGRSLTPHPPPNGSFPSSTDYDFMLLSVAAYDNNSCGSAEGWRPWYSMSNQGSYAQVCVRHGYCTVAFRGSNDLSDWSHNLDSRSGETTRVGYVDVHSGFEAAFHKITLTSNWRHFQARRSRVCARGIIATGHSLGGALASIYSFYDSRVTSTVTFASPSVGPLRHQLVRLDCQSRRYFTTSNWGSDPVPGLLGNSYHPHSGYEMNGRFRFFGRRSYKLTNHGCGSQEGRGSNIWVHLSRVYKAYARRLID